MTIDKVHLVVGHWRIFEVEVLDKPVWDINGIKSRLEGEGNILRVHTYMSTPLAGVERTDGLLATD